MSLINEYEFKKCVDRYKGDRHAIKFNCRDQFMVMSFAQFTDRAGLRYIETTLNLCGNLYRSGIKAIPRSTLAEANEKKDWRIYQDFAMTLVKEATMLYKDEKLRIGLEEMIYAFDSSTIELLHNPKQIIICEKSAERIQFVRAHYPHVKVVTPEECIATVRNSSNHGGADVVIEVAGADDTFQLAWEAARPNAIVTIVALYDKPQILPLPDMYGKNLTFKTGGVDGCDCAEILRLIEEGKIDTTPLITHYFALTDIVKAYDLFENKKDGVIKVAIKN